MLKTFYLWLEYRDATYYVAWTPYQDLNPLIVISKIGHEETGSLIRSSSTPLNVQFHFEEPMNYQEVQRFLEERAEHEFKVLSKVRQHYRFIHGKGVDPTKFSTI